MKGIYPSCQKDVMKWRSFLATYWYISNWKAIKINLHFFKEEKREKYKRFPYIHMLYSYAVHQNWKKYHSNSGGMFWMKIWLLFFLRSYSPFLRGSLTQIPKRKVDLQQLYKFSEFNRWMFSVFYVLWQMGCFLVLAAIVPLAGRQLPALRYLCWAFLPEMSL